MSAAAGLPEVEAVRTAGRGFNNEPAWVVKRCCFCQRRHTHAADPTLTQAVIPARCNATLFYRLREVSS